METRSTPVAAAAPPADDRELRCTACGTRVFTSRAPQLATANFRCPRCRGAVELIPAGRERA